MTILSLANDDFHRVFLSFRGDQLRYSFVSHLLDAFERHGILCFVDKDELRGENMTNLFVRIKESKIALVIFSSRYAESSWCMNDWARDVRGQTGEFGETFWALARTSRGDQIMKWKEALECISNKMGLSLGDKRKVLDMVIFISLMQQEEQKQEVMFHRSKVNFIKEVAPEAGEVLTTIQSDEGRGDNSVKVERKQITFH
ncbi:Toll/interleukin-1 receptor homology (TIR) domain [Arabidopsis thaliana x Arabidopsis arenosa]|uniref:Toll/interleukin-1 receptor homology (TIR) domain n=1 Tax=Arabidopsis thaliana x Arabidopsis arenosa TaxID=1240361 RepID=A0A8T2GRW4_9BRAS|nr:Toll/interleukin-1 receptor homology (TIR) domain [Arabidopsis thaliana x Arabidopsis arenosa]